MKYNAYGIKSITKLVNLGKEFAEKGMDDYAILDSLDKIGYSDDEAFEIVCAAMKYDITVEEKTWYRIGEPRLSEGNSYYHSFNFADSRPEAGVSVVTEEWLHSLKSVFFGAHDNEKLRCRGIYKIKGVQIGFGGDDEPVIYPTDFAEKTRIRSYSGLLKAVKENA